MLVLVILLGALLVSVWLSVEPSWARRVRAHAGINLGATASTARSAPHHRPLVFDHA